MDFDVILAKVVCAVYGVISLGFFSNAVVAGIVGNILIKLGSSLPNRHMLVYVLALCIVDALVLGTLPMLIVQIHLQRWIFGETMCTIYWTIDSINKTLSTFILTCLSFDRYLAVRFPHRCMPIRTVRGSLYILFSCVIFAALLLMPVYLHAGIDNVDIFPSKNDHWLNRTLTTAPTCAFLGESSYIFTIFMLCYFIPFACMSFFYGSMLLRLRRRSKKLGVRQARVRRVTTKTLTLVISYFIFWTPYWIMTLRHVVSDAIKGDWDENETTTAPNITDQVEPDKSQANFVWNAIMFVVMYVTHSGCYLNSAINPILYALLNRELRRQHQAAIGGSNNRIAGGSLVMFAKPSHAVSEGGISSLPKRPRSQLVMSDLLSDKDDDPVQNRLITEIDGDHLYLKPHPICTRKITEKKIGTGKLLTWITRLRRRSVICEHNGTGGNRQIVIVVTAHHENVTESVMNL